MLTQEGAFLGAFLGRALPDEHCDPMIDPGIDLLGIFFGFLTNNCQLDYLKVVGSSLPHGQLLLCWLRVVVGQFYSIIQNLHPD